MIRSIDILLGFLIAMLGSLAFDEIIFKADIDKQLNKDEKTAIETAIRSVDYRYRDDLNNLKVLVAMNQSTWLTSLDIARKEADGTGDSGRTGVSDITRLKMSIAKQNEKDYLKSDTALTLLCKKIADEKQNERTRVHFYRKCIIGQDQGNV
jgi:hypothetical protein